ncbi:MAG: hypothetical protein SGI74_00995 [Oligoflexia bacterium]|nr:hypothetical protein [Oligoflexia bacterium]
MSAAYLNIFFALVFSITQPTIIYADQEPQPVHIERNPGEPVCNETLKTCTYLVQNSSATAIISRMRDEIFGGIPLNGNINGDHLSVPNAGYISYWHHDETTLARMKFFIKEADRFEHFIPPVVVPIIIEVFEATDEGISEFEASLGINSSGNGKSKVSLKDSLMLLKTSKVSASLLALRTSREIEFKNTIRIPVPNLESFHFAHTSPHHTSFPNVSEIKTNNLGIDVRGEVSVSHEQQDLIRIKNLNINYGVKDFKNSENIILLQVSSPQIDLPTGVTYYIVSADSAEVATKKTTGLFIFGKNKEMVRKKLLVTIRANAMPWMQYIEQLATDDTNQSRATFTDDYKRNLCHQGNLDEVLNSLEPYYLRTPNGVPVLGFKLNPNLATLNTYQQYVNITIESSSGFKQQGQRQVENLMLNGGFLFKTLPQKIKDKPIVEFQVTLESANMHDGNFIQAKRKINLNYNTQNNLLTRKGLIPSDKPACVNSTNPN